MTENPANIRLVCPSHAAKPDPKFAKLLPASFIGGFVKIGIDVLHTVTASETKEHVWVEVDGVIKDKLTGIINNDFLYLTHYKCGDRVLVALEEIEDWLPPPPIT